MTELLFDVPQEIDPETTLPIGPQVSSTPARLPEVAVIEGRFCRLERLDASRHGDALYEASSPADAAARFRYLPDPAPSSRAEFTTWLNRALAGPDAFYAVVDRQTGRACGRQAFMRMAPEHRSIEIGNIYWGPEISRTPVATEALFLFAEHAFTELGYRRFEWKCDALNAPSRRAAQRFGFTFEGQFRRAVIVRGRTRDTAWYSIIDADWPRLKAGYERWLAEDNFDAGGQQLSSLAELIGAAS